MRPFIFDLIRLFQNTLYVKAESIGGMISTKPNIEWDFTCSYDTQYEVDESLTVQAATISTEFSQTNAQFDFNFDFYTDGLFEEILDSDLVSYQVGQYINFGCKYRVFTV